jgi:hypothetical protein
VAKNRYLNYDAIKRARTGGVAGQVKMTYAQLAKKFNCTESAAYYACNPGVRRARKVAIGKPRQVYAHDVVWAELRARARTAETSISRVVDAILYGEDPPLVRPPIVVEEPEEVVT